jgi:anti-sigma factor RsiW
MTISDEILSRYIDGELDEAEMTEITTAIKQSPALVSQLEALRNANAKMRDLYADLADRPIRADTLALLNKAVGSQDTPVTAAPAENIIAFKAKTPKKPAAPQNPTGSSRLWAWQAMAAVLTLAVGFGGGAMMSSGGQEQLGGNDNQPYQVANHIDPATPLFAALEYSKSTVTVSLDQTGKTSATPLTSFQSKTRGYCREYAVQSPSGGSRNIACRMNDGWAVVASVITEKTPQNSDNPFTSDTFNTASQADAPLLDTLIMAWIEGDILSAADEEKAIAQSWAPGPKE